VTLVKLVELVWAFAALSLIIFVLLHSPKGDGIGGIGGQAQLFTSTKSAEKTLNRVTWTLAVVFISLTVVLSANWLPAPLQETPNSGLEAPEEAPPASTSQPPEDGSDANSPSPASSVPDLELDLDSTETDN